MTEHVAFTPLPSLAVQVTVQVPSAIAVTNPDGLTVTTLVLLLAQVTFLFVALVGRTVAVSVWVLLLGRERESEVLLSVMLVTG